MNLTPAQKTTLKTDIVGHGDTNALYVAGNHTGLADLYNAPASPDYIVWKTLVTINEVGVTFNAAELAGLTSVNTTRLQNLAAWLIAGINPSDANVRQFFLDVFSGAGGTNTRAALDTLWKRKASRFEKLFATGAGTVAAPSQLVLEGQLTPMDFIGL